MMVENFKPCFVKSASLVLREILLSAGIQGLTHGFPISQRFPYVMVFLDPSGVKSFRDSVNPSGYGFMKGAIDCGWNESLFLQLCGIAIIKKTDSLYDEKG